MVPSRGWWCVAVCKKIDQKIAFSPSTTVDITVTMLIHGLELVRVTEQRPGPCPPKICVFWIIDLQVSLSSANDHLAEQR
jgi:hypothetical protein